MSTDPTGRHPVVGSFGPLESVIAAEQDRGNPVNLVVEERQLHGAAPFAVAHHRMDREAIEAEFELGTRFEFRPSSDDRWLLVDTDTALYVIDGSGQPGRRARRKRARWWEEWTAAPRSRRSL